MLKPTNTAAEQIVKLQDENVYIDKQISILQISKSKNNETITAFEQIATWEEIPE